MREDVVQVRFDYLDLLLGQMTEIGRQGAAVTEYLGTEVCNPAGFGEPPCVLSPLAEVMDQLRDAFESAHAAFAGQWVLLESALAGSAGAFADRDATSSRDHRDLAELLDERRGAAA